MSGRGTPWKPAEAEVSELMTERDRYREALREIAEAQPKAIWDEDGTTVRRPDYRGIARAALADRSEDG